MKFSVFETIAYSYPNTSIEIWAKDMDSGVDIYFCNKGKTIPAQKLNAILQPKVRMN